MPSCLYGLLLSRNVPRLPGALAGVAGTPARVVDCGGLAAVVGEVPDGGLPPRLENLRAHDQVLSTIALAGITVAASRFGQTFLDDAALCREVVARAASLRPLLERRDGFVEMRLLLPAGVAPDAVAASAQTPGRAYLERLRTAAPGVTFRSEFGGIVADERAEYLPDRKGLAVAHLVLATRVAQYRSAAAASLRLVDARVVGPLPLYSFTQSPDGGP